MSTAQPVYRLTLRALAADSPPTIRLRHALKAFLRAYRLRCTSIEEIPPAGDQRPAGQPAAADGGPAHYSPRSYGE